MRNSSPVVVGVVVSLVVGVLAACPACAAAGDGSSFSIKPDFRHKEIYDVYEGLREDNQPLFITTDLALHTGHLLFDYSLRAVEIERLYDLADRLTKAMVRHVALTDVDPAVRADLLAFFCVPARILDPDFQVPADVKGRVEKDLALMEAHAGFAVSNVLESVEDFSQYLPRGHYTRNEMFQRYFKAMMWYGRRMFRVVEVRPSALPIRDPWSEGHMLRETRELLLITALLYSVDVGGRPAIETWKALYVPTTLFAGRTEDLNPMEVRALMDRVWGRIPQYGDLTDEKVREFGRAAAEFSKPKVDSSGAGRKGFCFMAQRFTPDSYIMQCVVTDADVPFGEGVPPHPLPYTGDRVPRPFTWGRNRYMNPPERRFMPRGLDVMAVFGCDEALAILKAEGDADYKGYQEMVAFLREDVGRMMAKRKEQNLYYAWLHALQPMMKPIASEHVPECLRSRRWLRKQLATALASWVELRHDTILYVKQSYTPTAKAMPVHLPVRGYVEPQPEVFRRIGRMVGKMRRELAALGVMPQGLEENYGRFAAACDRLAEIAGREVRGQPLTEEDYAFIRRAAGLLKRCTLLPDELREKILSGTDSQMALVADVHTDNNAKKVLEEAVGTPFLLTVRMPLDGEMTTLRGAVFSYYEFKQPMQDRLTDEAWQQMLKDAGTRPALPGWYPSD